MGWSGVTIILASLHSIKVVLYLIETSTGVFGDSGLGSESFARTRGYFRCNKKPSRYNTRGAMHLIQPLSNQVQDYTFLHSTKRRPPCTKLREAQDDDERTERG